MMAIHLLPKYLHIKPAPVGSALTIFLPLLPLSLAPPPLAPAHKYIMAIHLLPGARQVGADVGRADAGRADAGRADAGRADAGRADAGPAVRSAPTIPCLCPSLPLYFKQFVVFCS